jgi:hypothetical protein
MTVAGPRRIHTGFLRRHRLTATVSHFDAVLATIAGILQMQLRRD